MPGSFPPALLALAALLAGPVKADTRTSAEIDQAFLRLYNFDFRGAQSLLDRHIASHPKDPLGYGMRSSALLFTELDRLGILESEFFADDKRIIDKKKLKPDPEIKTKLFQAVGEAESRALADLNKNPNDTNALFSLCMTSGVVTDYTALVEKRQLGSLSHVKRSVAYAQKLLKINPNFVDAHLSTGITEYLLGSMPFFVRWFIRVDEIQGNKEAGIQNVELVAKKGNYLKPFAKILLAIAYIREKKPSRTETLLGELSRDFPENPLFRKELAKVSLKLRNGELRDEE